jgi:hypothetical protein
MEHVVDSGSFIASLACAGVICWIKREGVMRRCLEVIGGEPSSKGRVLCDRGNRGIEVTVQKDWVVPESGFSDELLDQLVNGFVRK